MSIDLDPRIRSYTQAVAQAQRPIEPAEVRRSFVATTARKGLPTALAAALVVVILIGGFALLVRFAPGTETVTGTTVGSETAVDIVRSDPSGGTPFPDLDAALPGDDGAGPLPLGVVTTLPDTILLDFLFELCWTPNCFRDAHFIDPSGSGLGSGAFEPDTPFHIREGFPVTAAEPLAEGFDVVVYVTPLGAPGEFGGSASGATLSYTAEYVVRGDTAACGPDYERQVGTVTCEWFVHEFGEGLPAGRHAIWVVWEAPCWAWVEYGFVESCADPDEVQSLFSSGFDAPFEVGATAYLSIDGEGADPFGDPTGDAALPEPVFPDPDGSGAAPTGGTPLPDVAGALAGDTDDSTAAFRQVTLPTTVHLDFLFEICWYETCFRDAHFMDPSGSGRGSGTFPASEPFHIREGFPAVGDEPVGDGFDVAVYVTPMDQPGEFGGGALGATVRYNADYRVRGEADGCGPTYRSQPGPVACEWFVHEFGEGLPAGRHAIWVVWEAPCWAWVEYGFVESCADPDEVMSLFSSGFDAPFGVEADYSAVDRRPRG
ncbi:MAG: hypothetical protein ACLGHX_04685 [Acidimicrobiia bacterium]